LKVLDGLSAAKLERLQVIPREGVERLQVGSYSEDHEAYDQVIPREGVERSPNYPELIHIMIYVIPREGVERSVDASGAPPPSARDPERGS
jgi:hypothetical protein